MASSRITLFVGYFAALVFPFVMWGALILIARLWNLSLRPTLPWLKALEWITWLVGAPLLALWISDSYSRSPLPLFGGALALVSAGFGLLERWVEKRYFPESL